MIKGVPEGRDVAQKTVELLREKLNVVLFRNDINYGVKLKTADNSNLVRLAFNDQQTQDRIYKTRTKLKRTPIWLGEDLTTRRSNLAFKARERVRQGKAEQTWTFGGNIYIKIKRDGKPQKINMEEDLP
jgi:hypothetical protein